MILVAHRGAAGVLMDEKAWQPMRRQGWAQLENQRADMFVARQEDQETSPNIAEGAKQVQQQLAGVE
jgi:hypothetical protein